MEGVEIGNEIWVWAGRVWIVEMLSTDFTDCTDFISHANRRDYPVVDGLSTDPSHREQPKVTPEGDAVSDTFI
jgi:hypothetical protein